MAERSEHVHPPDDLAGHVGFYITFNYGDVWECDDDCPACVVDDFGSNVEREEGN